MLIAKQMSELHYRHFQNLLKFTDAVKFKVNDEWVETTYGRLMVWEEIGYLPTGPLDKKGSKAMIVWINESFDNKTALLVLKKVQDMGFAQATQQGLSICMDDLKPPEGTREIIAQAAEDAKLIPDDMERAQHWDTIINRETKRWMDETPDDNAMQIMGKSGARVKDVQIRQMIIAKGLLVNMNGKVNPNAIPVSLAQGLDPLSYFNTAGPARRGLASNVMIVPASGYLTRQLVGAARNLYFSELDCGDTVGIWRNADECRGRYTTDGLLITKKLSRDFEDGMGYQIRSPITCRSVSGGLCVRCMGQDPATRKDYRQSLRIGIVSAQHLSEPSTQLGLQGKHTSGSVTLGDEGNKIDNVLGSVIKSFGARSTSFFPISGIEIPTLDSLIEETGDIVEASVILTSQLHELYLSAGASVSHAHIELLTRARTEYVMKRDGTRGIRFAGDLGEIEVLGVGQVASRSPSWLTGVSFSAPKAGLTAAVSNMSKSYNTPTEQVLTTKMTGA